MTHCKYVLEERKREDSEGGRKIGKDEVGKGRQRRRRKTDGPQMPK